jgi:hypothetical protein
MTVQITPVSSSVVEVRFKSAPVLLEFSADVIADVNNTGNWIYGIELLGSGLQFSLERALASFAPEKTSGSVRRIQNKLTVTYDEDANAGFLYLPYASPASIEQEAQSNPLLLKSSYSIEDDKATMGLAADKTLVFVRFVIPAREKMETFLRLFLGS